MKGPVHKRGGSGNWYVRVQIPLESQGIIGKKEIWRSLGTADRKLANKLAHAKIAEVQREIELKIATGPKQATREDIQNAARRFYHYEVESDAEERVHDVAFVRERMKLNPLGYRPYLERLRQQLAGMDYSEIEADAELVLDYEKLILDKDSPLYAELLQLLLRARIQATARWIEHDKAIFGEEPGDKFFRAEPAPLPTSPAAPAKSATLMGLYEKYASVRAATIKGNTIDERRNTVLRFSQFVGLARDPVSITRPEARAWRELLKEWPKYADQASEFAGQEFKQVLATNKRVGRATISVRTLNKYITDLSSFFDWLVREDHVEKNIFDGLSLEAPDVEQPNQSFSSRQLSHLFKSPLFVGCRGDDDIRGIAEPGNVQIRDWRYWLPIIALYSGARMGEIAQLEIADIQKADGIDFFYFTNEGLDPLKSMKTRLSKRRVPIHSAIIELGFPRYLDAVRSAGSSSVFPELKRDSKGHFSMASKFFQRYFEKIGLKKMEAFSTNFHSFRHGFIDELRLKYPQDELFKSILGHAGKSVTTGYGVREVLELKKRQELVESVGYQGVDLSALRAAAASR